MDELKISDRALEESIISLKRYCARQIDRIETFSRDIKSLSENWTGSNFDSLHDSVQAIGELTVRCIDSINQTYTRYLNEKSVMFKARPMFNGAQNSSSSAISSSSERSGRKTVQTIYEKVFEKHNKELVNHMYLYLRKIRFYVPDDRISFYDPDGKSKRGLYKNIMGIDINSDQCESDLLLLTGQHIYFQMRHDTRTNLLRTLATEMNSKRFTNEIAFTNLAKKIASGQGINYKYLKFDNSDERLAFNFFTFCYSAYISNNVSEIEKYQKYYSNSYRQFKEILMNVKDA